MDHGLWPGEATAFGRVRQNGGEVGQVRADIGFGHADIRVCRHWPLARWELVGCHGRVDFPVYICMDGRVLVDKK